MTETEEGVSDLDKHRVSLLGFIDEPSKSSELYPKYFPSKIGGKPVWRPFFRKIDKVAVAEPRDPSIT